MISIRGIKASFKREVCLCQAGIKALVTYRVDQDLCIGIVFIRTLSMEGNDEFVGLSFLQAEIVESNSFRVVFIESKCSFLLLERIAVEASTVVAYRIGPDNTDSHVFPTASNLWRVSELNVVVHRLRNVVDSEGDIATFVDLQETWTSPCCRAVRIILTNNDCAILSEIIIELKTIESIHATSLRHSSCFPRKSENTK